MAIEWAALWGGIKGLASAAKEAGKLELYEKALDLQQQVQELYEENRASRQRIGELEAQLRFAQSVRFERNAYWVGEGYAEHHGPYGPRCFDDEKKGIRMIRMDHGYAQCPKCNTAVTLEKRDDRERPSIERSMPDDW